MSTRTVAEGDEASELTSFYWYGHTDVNGNPLSQGLLCVQEDGSIELLPDDDYYNGTISKEEAVKIAKLILDRASREVL